MCVCVCVQIWILQNFQISVVCTLTSRQVSTVVGNEQGLLTGLPQEEAVVTAGKAGKLKTKPKNLRNGNLYLTSDSFLTELIVVFIYSYIAQLFPYL